MTYKFKEGETVYVATRYDGPMECKIVAGFIVDGKPCYQLDKFVPFCTDGSRYGSAKEEKIYRWDCEGTEPDEGVYVYTRYPCPEYLIMRDGDVYIGPFSDGKKRLEIHKP